MIEGDAADYYPSAFLGLVTALEELGKMQETSEMRAKSLKVRRVITSRKLVINLRQIRYLTDLTV